MDLRTQFKQYEAAVSTYERLFPDDSSDYVSFDPEKMFLTDFFSDCTRVLSSDISFLLEQQFGEDYVRRMSILKKMKSELERKTFPPPLPDPYRLENDVLNVYFDKNYKKDYKIYYINLIDNTKIKSNYYINKNVRKYELDEWWI
ncbi:MAG: hypothetical protein ACLFUO_02515 [Candidatus Woesearchaeota archaeon]